MRPKRLKTAVVSTNGCENKSDTNSVIDSNDGSISNLTSIENNNNNGIEDNHKTNSETIDEILDYSPKLCLRCHCKQNGNYF